MPVVHTIVLAMPWQDRAKVETPITAGRLVKKGAAHSSPVAASRTMRPMSMGVLRLECRSEYQPQGTDMCQ